MRPRRQSGQPLRLSIFAQIATQFSTHLYRTGASLYYTLIAPADEAAPLGQWQAAKRAAGDAIVAGGGTITHHHAVGRDHIPWMRAEVGELGLAALHSVKERLDPVGIMNPGKLFPPQP